jgi:hypothetical protein
MGLLYLYLLHLAEENEESNDSLSENSVSPSEDSKEGTADYRSEASLLELSYLFNHIDHE